MEKYGDILHLSPPISGKRAKMTNYDRAAQFSPFAALTGFEAAIAETGRLTDSRIQLEEDEKQRLDEQMQAVLKVIQTRPKVEILWFQPDERKDGGGYVSTSGCVKKIDSFSGRLILSDGRTIPLEDILSVQLKNEPGQP